MNYHQTSENRDKRRESVSEGDQVVVVRKTRRRSGTRLSPFPTLHTAGTWSYARRSTLKAMTPGNLPSFPEAQQAQISVLLPK